MWEVWRDGPSELRLAFEAVNADVKSLNNRDSKGPVPAVQKIAKVGSFEVVPGMTEITAELVDRDKAEAFELQAQMVAFLPESVRRGPPLRVLHREPASQPASQPVQQRATTQPGEPQTQPAVR